MEPSRGAEIVEAAGKAPVYSADRPWALELHGRSVYLFERGQRTEHDPLGFDRLLSCGAALEHVVLAIRYAGWHPRVVFPSDQASPDLVAIVHADRREPAGPQDLDLHRAIRLADASGGGDARRTLGWANHWAGTELRALSEHELVVIATDDRRPDHVRGGAVRRCRQQCWRDAAPEWRSGRSLISCTGANGGPA